MDHSYREAMEQKPERKLSKTAVKVGIFGAVALGAAVSGFLVSRQGRRFVRDVWDERRRTPLEDRVLDAIWADRKIGRRAIEVQEIEPGVIALTGKVRSREERKQVRTVLARIKEVREIEDRLELVRRRR